MRVGAKQIDYTQMDVDTVKETLRFASDEAIQELAKLITQNQYEYSIQMLPLKKAVVLKAARERFSSQKFLETSKS